MKTIIFLSALYVGVAGGANAILAGENDPVRVEASRAFCLATVRALDAKAPWQVLQDSFVASFSKSLAGPDGKPMPVRPIVCEAAKAAEMLRTWECDAVLVLGDQLPSALKGSKFVSTKAVSQIGTPVYVFLFVTRGGDPVAQSTMVPAFERATSSDAFQESVGRASAVRVIASHE